MGSRAWSLNCYGPVSSFTFFHFPFRGQQGRPYMFGWLVCVCIFLFLVNIFWCVCMVLCEEMQFIFGHSEGDGWEGVCGAITALRSVTRSYVFGAEQIEGFWSFFLLLLLSGYRCSEEPLFFVLTASWTVRWREYVMVKVSLQFCLLLDEEGGRQLLPLTVWKAMLKYNFG